MAFQTIHGMVIETEPDEEEIVAVAIETETHTYLVAPPEMAEELLDFMGHHLEAIGTITQSEDDLPVIEIDSYSEVFEEADEEREDEDEISDDTEHLGG